MPHQSVLQKWLINGNPICRLNTLEQKRMWVLSFKFKKYIQKQMHLILFGCITTMFGVKHSWKQCSLTVCWNKNLVHSRTLFTQQNSMTALRRQQSTLYLFPYQAPKIYSTIFYFQTGYSGLSLL